MNMSRTLFPFVVVVILIAMSAPAAATWSVVGVDPESGQVGVAVASCVPVRALDTSNGFELVALAPGKGAGISQALYNDNVPPEIERLLAQNVSAPDIIAALTGPDFDSNAEDRLHAVVLLSGQSEGFTGADNSDVALDAQGVNVSAQGNISPRMGRLTLALG